ncbi:MAG: M15 family metallopeptidase [Bacteroidales bacterium]|nr:M15 family metallopeptidase [Bacteroidales bacterium]
MKKIILSLFFPLLLSLGVVACRHSSAQETGQAVADQRVFSDDSSDFVMVTDVVPDAILEIRYYSTYNFVGQRIAGYEAPVALCTKEAAAALAKANAYFMERGYRIKIYDAYRPQMAVDHFMRWARVPDDTLTKAAFYPDLPKNQIAPQNYVSSRSGHTRGSTFDLTLVDVQTGKELDMGGAFDFFGECSHPNYEYVTEEQHDNRMLLRSGMLQAGFRPLYTEWWHFTLVNEPFPNTYFTFPVQMLEDSSI